MPILQQGVEFICRLRYADLPKDAVAGAKNAIIDTIACVLSGVNEPASQKVLTYVRKQRTAGAATVPGTSYRFSPGFAALASGTMAHALDYDDVLVITRSHPSAVLVPAVLAVGEDRKSSGREIITAYLAGLEAIAKIGTQTAFQQYATGWHTTGTIGVFGAAAAAGKLLGLSEHEMTMAMGLVASMAGGLQKNFGSMAKPLLCGLAAQSGIVAASLAADGFTASEDILGDGGYFQVLADPAISLKKVSFGAPFAITSPGLNVKCYPCCDATHRALDAIFLKILPENPSLDVRNISSITCRAPAGSFGPLIHDSPQTGMEARFSMQYAVAASLTDRRLDNHSFTDKMVQRGEIRSLMQRVVKVQDPKLPMFDPDGTDCRFTQVTVAMADGQSVIGRISCLKGSGGDPLTDAEMAKKFLECSSGVLSPSQQSTALDTLQKLETQQDISGLMENMAISEERAAGAN
jgi:2-methylcitrate dehydratase PrpD